MDFNLQEFLRDMRREQKADYDRLVEKVEDGFSAVASRAAVIASDLASHEQEDLKIIASIDRRLMPIESFHKSFKWVSRSAITAVIAVVLDFVFNHLPKFFIHKP